MPQALHADFSGRVDVRASNSVKIRFDFQTEPARLILLLQWDLKLDI